MQISRVRQLQWLCSSDLFANSNLWRFVNFIEENIFTAHWSAPFTKTMNIRTRNIVTRKSIIGRASFTMYESSIKSNVTYCRYCFVSTWTKWSILQHKLLNPYERAGIWFDSIEFLIFSLKFSYFLQVSDDALDYRTQTQQQALFVLC